MPRLLFHGDPVLVANHPGSALGHCVTRLPDGFPLSKDNASRFLVVDTDMPEAECDALFLADGADPNLAQAEQDAQAALDQARSDVSSRDPVKDFLVYDGYVKARDAAAAALDDAHEALRSARSARPRAFALDLSVLPKENTDAPTAIRAAIDAVAVDAKAAAKSALLDVIDQTFGQVDQATIDAESKDIIESVAARANAAKIAGRDIAASALDLIQDALLEASRLGRAAVEDPVFDAFSIPKPVFLDAKALAAAAVPA